MVEVGAAEIFAGGAVAIGVNGAGVGGKLLVVDVDSFVGMVALEAIFVFFQGYFAGIKGAVSGESGWSNAIEHINAQRNGSEDIRGF